MKHTVIIGSMVLVLAALAWLIVRSLITFLTRD